MKKQNKNKNKQDKKTKQLPSLVLFFWTCVALMPKAGKDVTKAKQSKKQTNKNYTPKMLQKQNKLKQQNNRPVFFVKEIQDSSPNPSNM